MSTSKGPASGLPAVVVSLLAMVVMVTGCSSDMRAQPGEHQRSGSIRSFTIGRAANHDTRPGTAQQHLV